MSRQLAFEARQQMASSYSTQAVRLALILRTNDSKALALAKKQQHTLGSSKAKSGTILTKAQEKQAIDRVLELMAIPGKSGDELGVADYVRQELLAAGAKPSQIVTDTAHKKTPIKGDTGNLIFHLPGTVTLQYFGVPFPPSPPHSAEVVSDGE